MSFCRDQGKKVVTPPTPSMAEATAAVLDLHGDGDGDDMDDDDGDGDIDIDGKDNRMICTQTPRDVGDDDNSPTLTCNRISHDDRIAIARKHFVKKGYRVHSGLQFGCELVLYADIPSRVHSDFCVHIPQVEGGGEGEGEVDTHTDSRMNWMTVQILVRSMPELHKTLIIANVKPCSPDHMGAISYNGCTDVVADVDINVDGRRSDSTIPVSQNTKYYIVEEIAVASEHAPFRHKNVMDEIGVQLKKKQKSK